MVYTFLLTFLLQFSTLCEPQATCDELIRYARSEGSSYGSVGTLSLYSSEWLKSVEAYKVDGVLVVIASIKKEGSYFSKDYIFCSVPESNWRSFKSIVGSESYGERFHNYIIDYQCNCN